MASQHALDRALGTAVAFLAVDDMERALAAGANPKRTFQVAKNRAVSLAECVLAAVRVQHLAEEVLAARQVAALQVLAKHGGLDAGTATRALLHRALRPRGRHPAVVQVLLDAGVDLTSTRLPDGSTPLHLVTRADVAQLLVDRGADVNAKGAAGRRPLHEAVCFDETGEQRQIVRVLVAAGAALDAVDGSGQTCLFRAIFADTSLAPQSLVPLLLDAGVDPTIADNEGDTPLATALRQLRVLVSLTASYVEAAQGAAACVRLLIRSVAWRRRRHMLLAVAGRWRRRGSAAAATAATDCSGTAALVTSAAAGGSGGQAVAGTAVTGAP